MRVSHHICSSNWLTRAVFSERGARALWMVRRSFPCRPPTPPSPSQEEYILKMRQLISCMTDNYVHLQCAQFTQILKNRAGSSYCLCWRRARPSGGRPSPRRGCRTALPAGIPSRPQRRYRRFSSLFPACLFIDLCSRFCARVMIRLGIAYMVLRRCFSSRSCFT